MLVTDHAVTATQPSRRAAGSASGSPTGAQGVAGVVVPVAEVAGAVPEELRIRRDMRELRAMDDDMLEDIGLTRADIGSVVRYGRD